MTRRLLSGQFVIGASSFNRHSAFGIRHWCRDGSRSLCGGIPALSHGGAQRFATHVESLPKIARCLSWRKQNAVEEMLSRRFSRLSLLAHETRAGPLLCPAAIFRAPDFLPVPG